MKKQQLSNPALTFITPADILRILTHITTYMGAYYRLQKVKECIGKEKHQRVTVKEFADWEGLDAQQILLTIKR